MSENKKQKLTLYHRSFCYFCSHVIRAIKQLDAEVDDKNIWNDAQALKDLEAATGRSTVPVLRIETAEGEISWLPESNDIVAYLSARAQQSAMKV